MALSATNRGSGGNVTSATTVTATSSGAFAAGSWGVLVLAYDNQGSAGADNYSSIANDSRGNTWTSRQASLIDPGAAGAGACLRIFTCAQNAATILNGTTVVVTFAAAVVAKAWVLYEVTASGTISYVTGNLSNSTTLWTAGAAPTITSTSIASGDMIIGGCGAEFATSSITGDADTTNGSWSAIHAAASGGTTSSGMCVGAQWKVVTAAGAQTYDCTIANSADSTVAWIQLHESQNPTRTAAVAGAATVAGVQKASRKGVSAISGAATVAAIRTVNRKGVATIAGAARVNITYRRKAVIAAKAGVSGRFRAPFPLLALDALGAQSASTAGTVNPQIPLPSYLVAGDQLLVFFRWGNDTGSAQFPAGWNQLFLSTADAANDITALYWYKVTGSEGWFRDAADGFNFVSVTRVSGTTAGQWSAIAVRVEGAQDFAVQPPEVSAIVTGTSLSPDPASLTPAGGSKKYLWLALAGAEGANASLWPTSYDLYQAYSHSGGATAAVSLTMMGARQLQAASDNPGAFELSVSDDWSAWTVAITPYPQAANNVRTATIAGAATVAAIRKIARKRITAIAASATVAAIGKKTNARFATISGAATVAAIRRITRKRTTAIAATATVAALGKLTKLRTSVIAAAATVAVIRKVLRKGAVAIASSATVAAVRKVARRRVTAITATATVAAVYTKSGISFRTATIAASTTVAAIRKITRKRATAIAAVATVAAQRKLVRFRTAAVAALATVGSLRKVTRGRAALIGALSTIAAVRKIARRRLVAVSSFATVAALRKAAYKRHPILAATASISAIYQTAGHSTRTAVIAGLGVVTALRTIIRGRKLAVAAVATVTALRKLTRRRTVSVAAQATLQIGPIHRLYARRATIAGVCTVQVVVQTGEHLGIPELDTRARPNVQFQPHARPSLEMRCRARPNVEGQARTGRIAA